MKLSNKINFKYSIFLYFYRKKLFQYFFYPNHIFVYKLNNININHFILLNLIIVKSSLPRNSVELKVTLDLI